MKKLILSVSAVVGLSLAGHSQGSITFDGSSNANSSPTAGSGGLVFINGTLDTTQDINAELLYSTTQGGTYNSVVTLLLSSQNVANTPTLGQISSATSDVTFDGNGTLYDVSGNTYAFPGIASGTTAYLEVQSWLGNFSSLAAAQAAGMAVGTTLPFTAVLSGQNPPYANVIGMPALNLTTPSVVPEPSSLAMAGVGMASLLMFRRRKS